MSKFNTVRKVPNSRKRSRKHLVKTIKKPKLSTELIDCQLEKNLKTNRSVFRESKYRKKVQSNIRKIIGEEVK